MRRSFAFTLCLALTTGSAGAQPIRSNPGTARDYIILRQPQADHRIVLRMRPTDQSVPPDEYQWERWDPNGPGYTELRRIDWQATASCASGLDWIRIDGPGGDETQSFNGTRPSISGRTHYESFDPDALDAVCRGFARQATQNCGENPILEPGCENEETYVFGPSRPLRGSAPVTVSGRCESGPLPTRQYVPRLELRCLLGG